MTTITQAKQRYIMSKKNTKKAAPSSGQSGPELDLEVSDLNPRELRVVMFLNQSGQFGDGSGKRTDFTIAEIAAGCWKNKPKAQANSWARNCLRRLVRSSLIEKQDRGVYRVSQKTRNALAKVADKKAAKADKKAADKQAA